MVPSTFSKPWTIRNREREIEMNRAGAVVQARMGSRRLPGKVLAEISGRPMLWHIVNRLRSATSLTSVGVATSDLARDDAIEDFCNEHEIACFRGSEDDVLGRFVSAATAWRLDPVVRITADCPFVCPHTVDVLVRALNHSGADFAE